MILVMAAVLAAGSSASTSLAQDGAAVAAATATEADPVLLQTFDRVWEIIRDTHFDTNYNGVDWDAVRDELRPEAEKAESPGELRDVINTMLKRLNQSHFALLPSEMVDAMEPEEVAAETPQAEGQRDIDQPLDREPPQPPPATGQEAPTADSDDRSGATGIEVRPIEDQMIVMRVFPDTPAAEAGVRPGWIVKTINGEDVESFPDVFPADLDRKLARMSWEHMATNRLNGPPDSTVAIEFVDENDESRTLELVRTEEAGVTTRFGNLPPMNAALSREWIDIAPQGLGIGVIRFNQWMVPVARPFDEAIDKFRNADGIILDLRGNTGGIGGMAMGIAGHFFPKRETMGRFITRRDDIKFITNPRKVNTEGERVEPYGGPVAILTDELSASTTEIFVGAMQGLGRAKVFGTATMGAALPAHMTRLPNGDVLLHAVANYINVDGQTLEGRGVIPDVPIELTRQKLLDQGDPVMNAAVEWIVSRAGLTR